MIPDENQPLLVGKSSIQESSERDGWICDDRLPQGNTSSLGAMFIIINAALGAGLLAFPVAFYSAGGIIPAMLTMLVSMTIHVGIFDLLTFTQFLLIWITFGLLVLAHLTETLQASTYEDTIGRACGGLVKLIVDICIIIYTFGTCIAFLVVIGDQLQDCKYV